MVAYETISWAQEYYNMGLQFLEDVLPSSPCTISSKVAMVVSSATPVDQSSMLRQRIKVNMTRKMGTPRDKLRKYLKEDVIAGDCMTDILEYWKSSSSRFLSLARLARDYLCVPCSTVDIERQSA